MWPFVRKIEVPLPGASPDPNQPLSSCNDAMLGLWCMHMLAHMMAINHYCLYCYMKSFSQSVLGTESLEWRQRSWSRGRDGDWLASGTNARGRSDFSIQPATARIKLGIRFHSVVIFWSH